MKILSIFQKGFVTNISNTSVIEWNNAETAVNTRIMIRC